MFTITSEIILKSKCNRNGFVVNNKFSNEFLKRLCEIFLLFE